MKLIWKKTKPTVPGRYRVRGGDYPADVEVYRAGRGLRVSGPGDDYRMSEIGKNELEWAELP